MNGAPGPRAAYAATASHEEGSTTAWIPPAQVRLRRVLPYFHGRPGDRSQGYSGGYPLCRADRRRGRHDRRLVATGAELVLLPWALLLAELMARVVGLKLTQPR